MAVNSGLFKYPEETLLPQTYNSPGVSTGWRLPPLLTTNNLLFAKGLPIGTTPFVLSLKTYL